MSNVSEFRKPGDAEATVHVTSHHLDQPIWRRQRFRIAALGVLLVAIIGATTHFVAYRWAHVAIDDSRIAAKLVTVSSQVSGRVKSVSVLGGDEVARAKVLIEIDSTEAELALAGLEAEIAGTVAEQEELRARQDMIRTQIARKREAGQAEIAAAEAEHRMAEAVLVNARSNFDRISELNGRNVVAIQELEQSKADLASAEEKEHSSAAGITTSRANLAVTEAESAEIAVLDQQIAILDAKRASQIAARDQKKLELGHYTIAADFDGVVDGTFVDPGEYVSPGTRLLLYHDPKSVWVDANVKETDFRRLTLGAPAAVTVDAYPDRVFTGHVERLGEAVTSQFALLPSPNPSGNFTKVTQRLPVRIAIDQQDSHLRPGMMVEVSIDVVD